MGAKKPTVDTPIISEKTPLTNEVNEMAEPPSQMTFTTPTEFVELPSKGKFYSEKHPLYGKNDLEIRYLTAKDEDILTSRTLLKKGIAVDRMLSNIIVNKGINIDDLLIGDKNALVIASRISGYGSNYETNVTCPICGATNKHAFDLREQKVNNGENCEELGVEKTENNTFIIQVPKTEAKVEVRLLTGHDEKSLMKTIKNKKKHNLPETPMTDQFSTYIVSVNGNSEGSYIQSFIQNMPALDSRHLRETYGKVIPNVDLNQEFSCLECGYEQEMEVPFTSDFFWPR